MLLDKTIDGIVLATGAKKASYSLDYVKVTETGIAATNGNSLYWSYQSNSDAEAEYPCDVYRPLLPTYIPADTVMKAIKNRPKKGPEILTNYICLAGLYGEITLTTATLADGGGYDYDTTRTASKDLSYPSVETIIESVTDRDGDTKVVLQVSELELLVKIAKSQKAGAVMFSVAGERSPVLVHVEPALDGSALIRGAIMPMAL